MTITHAKEELTDDLALAPLRLLGGFICVDTHLGCFGCPYCLNRRQPLLDRVLTAGIHRDFAAAGLSVERAAQLLLDLPSCCRARVPIRIGHLTDLRYEEAGAARLVELLPADYPVVLMTRFPISAEMARFIAKRRNLLLHVTLTPPLAGAEAFGIEAAAVVDSLATVPPEQLFFMLRPLVAKSSAAVRSIFSLLQPGSAVGFRAMSTRQIPGAECFVPLPDEERDRLLSDARQFGLLPYDFFGCPLRRNLAIPFFKYPEARCAAAATCTDCPNELICSGVTPPTDNAIQSELARLGLTATLLRREPNSIMVEIVQPATRAEEIYLSELFTADVHLSTVGRGEGLGQRLLEEEIFARWERAGFMPVEELRRVNRVMSEVLLL